MKNFLIMLVLSVSIGCRAAVPTSFVEKMEEHHQNTLKLHNTLRAYVLAEIVHSSDKDLYDLLKLVNDDAILSAELLQWAERHEWDLAVSAE